MRLDKWVYSPLTLALAQGNRMSVPRIIRLSVRTETFRRTDVLVRPRGKPRRATDEDVRCTPQSVPYEVYLVSTKDRSNDDGPVVSDR